MSGLCSRKGRGLFFEDLHHGFGLGLVDLGQGLLHQGPIFERAGMQQLGEAERRVAEEDLGVLQALVIVGKRQVNLVGEVPGRA